MCTNFPEPKQKQKQSVWRREVPNMYLSVASAPTPIGSSTDYEKSLKTAQARMERKIDEVQKSGSVAPANHWLSEFSQKKNQKTYTYMGLYWIDAGGKVRSRSLGRPGSSAHQDWRDRLQRRDAIAELSQQINILCGLRRRVEENPITFAIEQEPEHD